MNKFFLLITTIFFITLFNVPKIALINETEPRQLVVAIQKHHKKQKCKPTETVFITTTIFTTETY
jgi:hypothetical protein